MLDTSDAHDGLTGAIAAALPGYSWQRCRTHYSMNLMSVTPKAAWPWVKALLHSVYDQPDRVVDALATKLPAVAEHLETARTDILAFTGFPQTRSGARSGRTTPTSVSTTRSAAAPKSSGSSDRASLVRPVGAVLAEQHDDCAEGRRYLGLDVLGALTAVEHHDLGGADDLTLQAVTA